MPKVTMWASERELCRLAANHLKVWSAELTACQDVTLIEVGLELHELMNRLYSAHVKAVSLQTSPYAGGND